ncbi:hypothetical protein M2132_000864 [Dysgonomonas sp. PH5-45]|uniref:hypothetical protein n=1 Tax=unclassified Dysgonomonas TaxID=2630389 RepID=UPI002474D62E|nr:MULTISPECIES: hypothetical protein [unclassified Dysgonomonas]MDH6354536.1 hypothetical protein [Dysgonomonas sp. PH5-45]MDH6387408.1 hypothetical protein [Dysgonomonas sp. PH5-37]
MKKILTLLLLACLLAACGSDDDEPEYFNPVEGVWEREGVNYYWVRVYTSDFTSYEEEWNKERTKKLETNEHGKYKVDGNKLIYKDFTYKYTIANNKLTLIYIDEFGDTYEYKYTRKVD